MSLLTQINQANVPLSLELDSLEQIIDYSPLKVTPDTPLTDAIALMNQTRASCMLPLLNSALDPAISSHKLSSCVLVVEESQLLGIFTERDVVKLTARGANLSKIKVADVMTQQMITIRQSDVQNVFMVLSLMRQHRIRHLPVLSTQGELVGLVTPQTIRQVLQPTHLLKLRSVSEVMTTRVIYAPPNTSLLSLAQMMAAESVSCVVIAEPDALKRIIPIGIITERDIVQFHVLELDLANIQAQVVMSTPLFCFSPKDSLWVAHQEMQRRHVRRLVVTGEQGELVGLVTQTSFLQVFDPLEMFSVITTLQKQVEERTAELTQVNQHLRQAQDELERRVEERTSELSQANALLQWEIAHRLQAEKQIRSNEERAQQQLAEIEAIYATAPIGLCFLDTNLRYLRINEHLAEINGLAVSEHIGRTLREVLPDLSDYLEPIYQQVIQSGLPILNYEIHGTTSAQPGIERDWLVSYYPLKGTDAQVLGVNVMVQEITEKKKLEAQFLRAQRLESLGTLASGIAHDLNNILTPILAVAQLLPLKLPNLDEQNQQLLKIQEESSQRGAELVKQILSFAQGVSLKRALIQVKHLLKEIERIVKSTFPKSIEIYTDIPSQNLWTILADPTQLHQVFMNLCINARDAMPDGGTLSISAQNLFIDENYARMNLEAQVGAYVVVTVSDTGCGIPKPLLERIFEPFFTTKEPGKGTGLGLSTVTGIIKNHGGFVKVDSEVGKGSRFQVYLPASDESAVQEASDFEMLRGNGELILIVDDEAHIREITKTTLEDYNYQILTANDSIEAFSLYAQHKAQISVVLMDIQMPSIDGLNAIRVLQKMNPAVKIIAISGIAANRQLLEAVSITEQAFLSKPYTIQELLHILQCNIA
jgi:PAS domain S-box-containing protein